jgi:hypothetical protein
MSFEHSPSENSKQASNLIVKVFVYSYLIIGKTDGTRVEWIRFRCRYSRATSL